MKLRQGERETLRKIGKDDGLLGLTLKINFFRRPADWPVRDVIEDFAIIPCIPSPPNAKDKLYMAILSLQP
jgi:hypothetical protein